MAGTRNKTKKPAKSARRARKVAKPRAKGQAKAKAAAKKSPDKPGKVMTRGSKPARRAKASAPPPAKPKPKAATPKGAGKAGHKPQAESSPRRRIRGPRPLLTSVRRPKSAKPRGPARARVTPHGRHGGANGSPTRYEIHDFTAADTKAVDAVALAAFEQFRSASSDWPEFAKSMGVTACLAEGGEIIVARSEGRIVGAVAYCGPGTPRPAMLDAAWPLIRMLAVDPAERRHGLGRLLVEECIRRARRGGAAAIALHTSPIMQAALAMYLRLGFVLLRQIPPVFGVPYRIYLKRL
jgi:ribosomal protein S18 acetylase RimI-like enzyme